MFSLTTQNCVENFRVKQPNLKKLQTTLLESNISLLTFQTQPQMLHTSAAFSHHLCQKWAYC